MADIDVTQDLVTVAEQLQKLVIQLQELDGHRANLAQQIQNLNGVSMYLRGKEDPTPADSPFVTGEADKITKET